MLIENEIFLNAVQLVFRLVVAPELSWMLLPTAPDKVVSIQFGMAKAVVNNVTGTLKSDFHMILNASTHSTGKWGRYLMASYGYMATRL